MKKRNWKRLQPTSQRHAMQLCKDYARERHNLSVERIAERMGLQDHWIIYKWIENGRIPAILIPAYESVCGINFVTRWLAASSDHLLIPIPVGRKSSSTDIQALQEVLNTAAGALLQFQAGNTETTDVLAAIQNGMEGLAWHRENVRKHTEPELDFERPSP